MLLAKETKIERQIGAPAGGRQDMVDVQFHVGRMPLTYITALIGVNRDHKVILKTEGPPLGCSQR